MIRHHPTNSSSSSSSSSSGSGSANPLPPVAEAPAAVPRPLPLTVCSVQDAAFYCLQVRHVRVDFAIGAARGLFPPAAAARPDHSLLQCPLAFEDCFRDLRRPAYVAQICRHMAFLTREARMNPFGYINLKTWADVERGGYALVTCLRPEFGMRAAIWVRSGRVVLGSAVLPLLDEEGRPLAEQKGLRVPTTRGGVHTGFFTCDVKLVQLAISPREQRVFA